MNKARSFVFWHLSRLVDFTGREARRDFWIWTACAFLILQLVFMVTVLPSFMRLFQSAFADLHQQMADPAYRPEKFDIAGFMGWFIGVTAINGALFIALTAAAVARRLHDCGRRGWWGFMPVPFLLTGLIAFTHVASSLRSAPADSAAAGAMQPWPVLLMFFNNLVYLATLALLGYLLSRPGQSGENRFGPPPAALS